MATTTNYSWTTPDDTDLVKDGAAAIRTLGTSADTTVKNLNPGTTAGDIDYYTTSTAKARIAIGTAGQVLKVNAGGTAPEWATDASGMTNPMTTTGDVIYSSSGSTPARLGIGTAGQILAVNSGATAPEWVAAPSSGGMTLISTTSISATQTISLTSIPSTYKDLKVVIRGFIPNNDDVSMVMRFEGDPNARYRSLASVNTSNSTFGLTSMQISGNQDNNGSTALIIVDIPDYTNTSTIKIYTSDSVTNNATTAANGNFIRFIGAYNQTGAIDELNFRCSDDANFYPSGTILLYGVK